MVGVFFALVLRYSVGSDYDIIHMCMTFNV